MRNTLLLLFLLLSVETFAQNANVAMPDVMPTSEQAKTTLRARVYYEDTGRAVKRTSVMLISSGGGGGGGRETSGITDGNGNLVIKNMRAGKYYAIVNAPGVVSPMAYLDLNQEKPDSIEQQLAGFAGIVVDGMTDATVQIPARRGGAISGRVIYPDGDPAIGVKVEILRKVGEEFVATMPNMSAFASMLTGGSGMFQTDDRGVFRFAGLAAGEYIVKATENISHSSDKRPGYDGGFETLFFGTGSMVSVFYKEGVDKAGAQTLVVEFGQEHSNIDMVIPDRGLYSIEGKLIAAKDKLPIRGAQVVVRRAGEPMTNMEQAYRRPANTTTTDEKGMWRFTELPKGNYKVIVEVTNSEFDVADQAYGAEPVDPSVAMAAAANAMATAANTSRGSATNTGPQKPPPPKFAKKAKELTIEDKDLTEQVIEMNFGAALSGTVSFEGKNSDPTSVTIVVSDESSEMTTTSMVHFYDYSGGRMAQVKKKEFKIDGISAGKAFITIKANDDRYYVKSASSGMVDLLKDAVELKEGDHLANIQIVLSTETGILTGSIIDSDKEPVRGMPITLVPTEPAKFKNASYHRTARSNEEGEFVVNLPPFEYALVSVPPNIAKKGRNELNAWLADAVKSAQTFKIEAGQTTKTVIKLSVPKPAK